MPLKSVAVKHHRIRASEEIPRVVVRGNGHQPTVINGRRRVPRNVRTTGGQRRNGLRHKRIVHPERRQGIGHHHKQTVRSAAARFRSRRKHFRRAHTKGASRVVVRGNAYARTVIPYRVGPRTHTLTRGRRVQLDRIHTQTKARR